MTANQYEAVNVTDVDSQAYSDLSKDPTKNIIEFIISMQLKYPGGPQNPTYR
jgi:hypothetical protein